MRPRERQETGEQDLLRSRLDRIIDLTHALVKLSRAKPKRASSSATITASSSLTSISRMSPDADQPPSSLPASMRHGGSQPI